MENSTIHRFSLGNLALYLRDAASSNSAKAASEHLLAAIEQEILPPTVFSIWLKATFGYAIPLIDALRQNFSKQVRKFAILQFGKELRKSNWKHAWNGLGGTDGLLTIFAQMSVREVKIFCKAVGRCKGRSQVGLVARQRHITELVQGLLPFLYPESAFKSTDERPLTKYYAQMVPACSSDSVAAIIADSSHPLFDGLPKRRIVNYHHTLLQRVALDALSGRQSQDITEDQLDDDGTESFLSGYLPWLLQSVPQSPGAEPKFSA